VSYDAANHQRMVRLRADKIAGIAQDIPLAEVSGDAAGELLIVGWEARTGRLQPP